MSSKIKLLISLSLILAVVIIVLVRNDKKQSETDALISETSQPLKETKNGSLEAPKEVSDNVSQQIAKTGDVDQVVNAILSDYAQDLSAAQAGNEDLNVLNADSSLINPDIYNANEF